jgi:hypothetical protein
MGCFFDGERRGVVVGLLGTWLRSVVAERCTAMFGSQSYVGIEPLVPLRYSSGDNSTNIQAQPATITHWAVQIYGCSE